MSQTADMLPACTLEHHVSEALEPSHRVSAWQEMAHPWVEFQPAPDVPLRAELHALSHGDCTLGSMRSSAYVMRTGARRALPDDRVVLSLVQAGDLRPQAWGRKGPGALNLCVAQEAGIYHWGQDARQAFLALPRAEVAAALGREPVTQLLSGRSALAPTFASQLAHAALLLRQGALSSAEYIELLQATRALALLMLRNLGRQEAGSQGPDMQQGLHASRHAAALRFMQDNAHRPELGVAEIARAAGCSRTRLYEAFAARGQTVMGVLRDTRLQRAQGLLAQSQRLNVGALAWRCGFADASGFSKLFRARFGLSPTEWHARALAGDFQTKEIP